MQVIRFQRVGRKNDPSFRIVLTEKRSKPKSGEQEILGSFHPKTKETRLNSERISYWLSKGAKASPRVWNLLLEKGVISGEKIKLGRGPVAKPETAPAAAAELPLPESQAVSAAVDNAADSS